MTANVNAMGNNPECRSYRKVEAQDEFMERLNNRRPGWDDGDTWYRENRRIKRLWAAWTHDNWTDAAAQADEIQMQNLSDKWHAEYCMETWGWTVDQYNKWVDAENKKQREHWTQIDFNEKLRNMEG